MTDTSVLYPAILFDVDGTLTMSLGAKVENAGKLLSKQYSVSASAVEAAYRKHSGVPRRLLFQMIAEDVLGRPLTDEEFHALSQKFTKLNVEVLKGLPFVGGAVELLRDLHAAGVKMALSTSAAPEEVHARFMGRRESRFFAALMGSFGDFHKGLPHFEHFSRITGCPISEVLMVGDESPDLKLAREAGANVALVAQTCARSELALLGPDILVDFFSELRPHLLRQRP